MCQNLFQIEFLLLAMLIGIGCDLPSPAPELSAVTQASASSTSVDKHTFDAGIIFAGTEQSMAFPLDALGITRAEQVQSIKTSCDCVTAEVVDYQLSVDEALAALIFVYVADELDSEASQMLLLELALELNDGSRRYVVVELSIAKRLGGKIDS